jgi:hypothetical protein
MNSLRVRFALLALFLGGFLTSCEHKTPLTSAPTGVADARLVGDWVGYDDNKSLLMLVRGYDAQNLSVSYDGQLYRVWPSAVGTEPFLTIHPLNEGEPVYLYANYRFENNGRELVMRIVSHHTVAEAATSAEAQEILRKQPPFEKDSSTEDLVRFTRVSPPAKSVP